MADLTIRSVFARLGFKIDDGKLGEFNDKGDKAKDGMVATTGASDRAREALNKVGAAGKTALGAVAGGAREAGSALKAGFGASLGGIEKTNPLNLRSCL